MKTSSLNTEEKFAAVQHEQASVAIETQTEILRSGSAPKIGKRSQGSIYYQISTDIDRREISIAITGNDGGGYFSREAVPFRDIEACLRNHKTSAGFPTKVFREMFKGRSVNNASFIVAALAAEKIIAPAPVLKDRHVVCGDYQAWKAALLTESAVSTATAEVLASYTQSVGEAPNSHTKIQRKTLTLKKGRSATNDDASKKGAVNAQN